MFLDRPQKAAYLLGMYTIAICGLKGGIGKSLIATLAACGFHHAERKTLLVDADTQGTTRTWAEKAAENHHDVPAVVGMDSRNILGDLKRVANGFEIVVVDTPARLGKEARGAMMVADVVLLPAIRGAAGLWALEQTLEILEEARAVRPDLPAYIVPNRIDHTTMSQLTVERLGELPVPSIGDGLSSRIAFEEAFGIGTDVVAYAPTSEAANEAKALYRALAKLETKRR